MAAILRIVLIFAVFVNLQAGASGAKAANQVVKPKPATTTSTKMAKKTNATFFSDDDNRPEGRQFAHCLWNGEQCNGSKWPDCCFGTCLNGRCRHGPTTTTTTEAPLVEGQFIRASIYTDRNFQGEEREILLIRGKCFPLFGIWYGNVNSIKMDHNACISVYQEANCAGWNIVLIGGAEPDLERNTGKNLCWQGVQSIAMCN